MAWVRGPTIGRGSNAAVSIATTAAGDVFAVKSTDYNSSALLKNEECLLSRICSPYVIRCLGSDVTCEEGKFVYNLFLEYFCGGSLADLIGREGGALGEKAIRFYAREILLGLEDLHLNGVVHSDVKAQNILIGGDGLNLKIADFGCAKLEKSGGFQVFSGTPAYMAPEVARGEEQSFAADVWAFGCTVIEMATGSHPWPDMKDPASALYRIALSGDVPEFPSWFSGEAKDFLGKCLVRDLEKRWTAAELLRHPFFAAVEESCEEIGEIIRRSPTSVTDQGFWDAVEASECCESPTEILSDEGSPSHRIGELICNGDSWCFDFEEEEDWLTVRTKQDEECEYLNQDLIETEVVMAEGEVSASDAAAVEDSWSEFSAGDSISACPVACNSNTQNVKSCLYSELSFLKIKLIKLFLHQGHIFLTMFMP